MGRLDHSTVNPAHHLVDFWRCFYRVTCGYRSVLEVGCGDGSNLQKISRLCRRTGIEVVSTYIPSPQSRNGVEFILGDARKVLPEIGNHSYEVVLLIDVLEHFTKDDGWKVLQHCDRIATGAIVLWVPEAFCPQNRQYYDGPLPYTEYQDHQSEWFRSELRDFGFDVATWDGYHFDRRTGQRSVTALFCVKEQEQYVSAA